MRDLPWAEWRNNPDAEPLTLLSRSPELAVNACLFCGGSLEGMRRDARYCSDSHRVMAARERKAA